MTTIAFDGKMMAGDTLITDTYGLISYGTKIYRGKDFLMGAAGDRAYIVKWWRQIEHMSFEEAVDYGYPDYKKDDNDPAVILAGKNGLFYKTSQGIFLDSSRAFHAVGSGRDFALAAMKMGRDAKFAVELAASFDNNTGGAIEAVTLEGL